MEEKKKHNIVLTVSLLIFAFFVGVAAYLIGNKKGQETIVNGTDAAINQKAIDDLNTNFPGM
jgi:hypothetical protein